MVKILIIDDSKAVHAFTKNCLTELGYLNIQQAFNGQEGISSLDNSIDIILLDWEMPIKDGPSTLKEIRANGLTIPIIVMTTRNSVEDITFMLGLGANDYMMKPFTADILKGKMEAVFELQKRIA
ncbi:MAG: response regulator transcription factor [Bacteriovoracaceae bacterium]